MSDDGSFFLRTSVRHTSDPAAATQATVTAKNVGFGIAVGPAKVKITSTTVSADTPPPIDKIWGFLVCREGSGTTPANLPPAVIAQLHSTMGFEPNILASSEISEQTPLLEAMVGAAEVTVKFGSGYSGGTDGSDVTRGLPRRAGFAPIVGGGTRGAANPVTPRALIEEGAILLDGELQTMTLPTPAQPNYAQIHFIYAESSSTQENDFSLTSALWVGAPVIAGPLQVQNNDTYVVCIATAKPDPARAKRLLGEMRTWTARTGQTTRATFVKEDAGRVTLRKEDGSDVTLAISLLSDADVELIKEATAATP